MDPLTGHGRQDREDIFAVDVLHRDEVRTARFTDVVNLDDVLMMQIGRDASLVEEHANEPRVPGVLGSDPLEHHMALEALDPVAASQQHISHSPGGNVLQHHIGDPTWPCPPWREA